jgi:hypothetical protein
VKSSTIAIIVVQVILLATACGRPAPVPALAETPPAPPVATATPVIELDASRPERLKLTAGITGVTERELPIEFPDALEWESIEEPVPQQRYLAPETPIVGKWARFSGDDAAVLIITSLEDSRYRVEFEAGGDLGGWKLDRVGEYHEGVFTLNRPVLEYLPREYRKLYAVRLQGSVYLVSSSVADELPRLEAEVGSSPWLQEMYLFSRQPDDA